VSEAGATDPAKSPDADADVTRRTWLALERTELAWWRTGLTALAVGIGVGQVVPELGRSPRWPYVVVGVGFALYGVALIVYGSQREQLLARQLERGLARLEASPATRLLAAAGALLGLATALLIVLG